MEWTKNNGIYLGQLLKRLGWIMLCFSLLRGCFLFFNQDNLPIAQGSEYLSLFAHALRFDLVAIVYVNSLFILLSLAPVPWRSHSIYLRIQSIVFLLCNGIALIFEVIDIGFFRFAFRRTIGSDLNLFQNTAGMIPKFVSEYWFLLIFYGILLFALYFLYQKTKLKEHPKFRLLPQIGIFLLALAGFIIGARGGLQLRPIMPITAAEYVSDMRLMPLVTNTSMSLIFSSQQRMLKEENYFSDSALQERFGLQQHFAEHPGLEAKNVVILVLESFGKEHVGFFNAKNAGYTPFLDSLIEESFYLEQSYANGMRSTQGIVAISAGIPALMNDPLMFSAYQSNRLGGLADILGEAGYTTGFYHGANPGSMEFERFSKLSGFQQYHDRRHFGRDEEYDGQWGIWDVPMLEYTAQQLAQLKQPFLAQFFSLTSHHPYKTPTWFEQKHPDDPKLLRSVRYADYALRQFFETASQMPWFENTLFVITADHIGKSSSPKFQTSLGKHKIPILFYDPSGNLKGKQPGLMQQIDIMPTVLDYLKYNKPFSCFGRSVLRPSSLPYFYASENNIFQIADTSYVLLYDGRKAISLYNHQSDEMLRHDSLGQLPAVERRLLDQLKAIIQVHNRAMIRNELK